MTEDILCIRLIVVVDMCMAYICLVYPVRDACKLGERKILPMVIIRLFYILACLCVTGFKVNLFYAI